MSVTAARPTIVIVGGFLGSGKTSLILAAARILARRGLRVAVVLNDQGEALVDTSMAQAYGLPAREVTGGCFCCRLSDLTDRLEELRALAPDVIFAEPVGSCTDISATVFAPLREDFDRFRIAPFSVLVDPQRALELAGPGADPGMLFLYRSQIDEADLICLTKSDLYPHAPLIPGHPTRRISAVAGQGVEEWIDEILFGAIESRHTVLQIDYARYAEAEAALAWLNLSFAYAPFEPVSPASAIGPFFDALQNALSAAGIAIVHLKMFDVSPTGWLKAAVCSNTDAPRVEGDLSASPSAHHDILLNLRAKGTPEEVRSLVENQLNSLEGIIENVRLECFSPAPPKPERRIPAL